MFAPYTVGQSPAQANRQTTEVGKYLADRMNTPTSPLRVYEEPGKVVYTIKDDLIYGIKYFGPKAKGSTGGHLNVQA